MANVYAVKSGDWSDVTVWNTGSLPTSSDDVFANNFRVVVNVSPTILSLRNSPTTGIVAGGGFNLTDGVTLTITGAGILGYNSSILVDFNLPAPQSATIVTTVINPPTVVDSIPTVRFQNTGTLNVIGDLYTNSRSNTSVIQLLGTGILNFTGNCYSTTAASRAAALRMNGSGTINMTGNILYDTSGVSSPAPLVVISASGTLIITGTVRGGPSNAISSSASSYIKIIGPIIANTAAGSTVGNVAFVSTSGGAINILTGPFISHSSGIQPIYVVRMHYQRTMGSYYEFRDNSTLGALPPSPPAPATRLVSPDTVADSPVPRDVRQGTIYAEGSQTGTMIVPSRDNVAKGVLVDNTVGTAILDADSIWAVPLTSINTLNSIGRRVKNAATVETTGAQIQQTLNDNK
jgi:hypothetical protein